MLNSSLDEIIARLGAAEKAALRLLIDFPEPALTPDVRKFLGKHPWTGVILFPKNIESASGVRNLIHAIHPPLEKRVPGFPPFIAVDQEGGSVSPLEGLLTPSPGNMALAATGNLQGTYELARQNGREMRKFGFNVNFSPVVDVNSNPQNPIIGIRSFGEKAESVAEFGAAVIRGIQEEGVMATAKHFPGHGDTSKDSHLELPVVDRSRDTLEQIDFLPFAKAVDAGVWGIMTAHVIFPGLDTKPATLSRTILTDLLRHKMGFQGIIFTDSFEMAAIKEHFDLEEAVLDSVKAGADVLLALGSQQAQLQIHSILTKAIEKKLLEDEDLIPSLRRILAFRKRLGDFKPGPPLRIQQHLAESLHEKSVTWLNGKHRLNSTGGHQVLLSPEATPHTLLFKRYFSEWRFVPWPWPSDHQADILFLAERRVLSPDMETALAKAAPKLECAAAFGNPYLLAQFPKIPARLTTYHINELLVKAAHGVLVEGKEAEGKLPVTL